MEPAALPAPALAEGPVRTAPATALEAAIAGAFARVLDGVTVDATRPFAAAAEVCYWKTNITIKLGRAPRVELERERPVGITPSPGPGRAAAPRASTRRSGT